MKGGHQGQAVKLLHSREFIDWYDGQRKSAIQHPTNEQRGKVVRV